VSIARIGGFGPREFDVKPGKSEAQGGFDARLQSYLEQLDASQQVANRAARQLAVGQSHYLHETMIALEKADIQFRLAMAVRNKVISAYQEIMRMQF